MTITWDISPNTPVGTYRIRYFGDSKNFLQQIMNFTGQTKQFKVKSLFEYENEIDSTLLEIGKFNHSSSSIITDLMTVLY